MVGNLKLYTVKSSAANETVIRPHLLFVICDIDITHFAYYFSLLL